MAREKDQNHAEQVRGTGSPWFNPQSPQTGNARTKRDPYDKVENVQRDERGRRQR